MKGGGSNVEGMGSSSRGYNGSATWNLLNSGQRGWRSIEADEGGHSYSPQPSASSSQSSSSAVAARLARRWRSL